MLASQIIRRLLLTSCVLSSLWLQVEAVGQADPPANSSDEQLEFFESRIRPVLIERCYSCHNSAEDAQSELAVDSREAIRRGGSRGALIVPGDPSASELLRILRHEDADLKMPKDGPKLDDRTIVDFEQWIRMGAPDPRDTPPSAEELAMQTSWEATLAKRKQWWSFRPIKESVIPVTAGDGWSRGTIDQFVFRQLLEHDLEPAPRADPPTLVRRLYLTLIGLPPSPEETVKWVEITERDGTPNQLVEYLLNSPHFGERWARHWMDWIRYAESHGSEGDPGIENAWYYRDYLIRALNADISFDQLVREHIAGDLLDEPRINEELGINESAIGTAHWRMVFHGFAPTDALDEKVRFTDDQINAFSKAFLGMTVSCARCHDHKFDAISQADYYALFGILGSTRPGREVIDVPEKLNRNRDELAALKPQIRDAIANQWLEAALKLPERLADENGPWLGADKPEFMLHTFHMLKKDERASTDFAAAWNARVDDWQQEADRRETFSRQNVLRSWNLAEPDGWAHWYREGNGLPDHPQHAGDFRVAVEGGNALDGIFPAGVVSGTHSTKAAARFASETFRVDGEYEVWLNVIGDGGAALRYVVQNYPRNGTVFPVKQPGPQWKWEQFDLSYWDGDDIHLELTAGPDAPLLVRDQSRSWFGVRAAVVLPKGQGGPVRNAREFLDPVFAEAAKSPPDSFAALAARYSDAILGAIVAWKDGTATDAQALLLDACLKQGLLPNTLVELSSAKPLLEEYRRLEAEIPVPTRVPGLDEHGARNQPLFIRGNHKQPGDEVPRRFLEAIDATPYDTALSGRRELAEDVLRPDNPLTRRVIVNRIWHHLFGRGIVATPDNFGRLGDQPTHPELLDYLASHFAQNGGSFKRLIREIVLSETWQQSSHPSNAARQRDPGNRLLSHANVRRLEAEAIRDALLTVSGDLDRNTFGPPVGGESNRRSVYVRVIRNSLDPFLRTFDFPEPYSSTGRRDATNVPAQSLTMMNDRQVIGRASAWAGRVLSEDPGSDAQRQLDQARIKRMFFTAFARPATAAELQRMLTYLETTTQHHQQLQHELAALRDRSVQLHTTVTDIMEPARTRLLAQIDTGEVSRDLPEPIARWNFDTDLKDSIGTAHGTAEAGARLEDGALVLDGRGYVVTAPLQQTLKEKTLQAWVQLNDLNQRGGGAITIQTPNGVLFDSIVFAEREERRWMAGSNGFQRTENFAGAKVEEQALTQPVCITITYSADGTITGYRNGEPYGQSYRSNGPLEFKADATIMAFGVRHFPPGGNRMLSARIPRAQLFDRVLTPEEVQATSSADGIYISRKQVLAALPESERERVEQAEQQIAVLDAEIKALGPVPETINEQAKWTEVARAIFSMKEFLYLR